MKTASLKFLGEDTECLQCEYLFCYLQSTTVNPLYLYLNEFKQRQTAPRFLCQQLQANPTETTLVIMTIVNWSSGS